METMLFRFVFVFLLNSYFIKKIVLLLFNYIIATYINVAYFPGGNSRRFLHVIDLQLGVIYYIFLLKNMTTLPISVRMNADVNFDD